MENKIKKVLFVENWYGLLVYFMYNKKFYEDTLFIFSNEKFIETFKKNKISYKFLSKEEYEKILKIKFKPIKAFKKKKFELEYKKEILKELKQYKNLEYIGHDHILSTKVIWNNIKEFILLEDGLMNYEKPEYKKYVKFYSKLNKKNLRLGLSPKVKKIFLTGLKEIPEYIKDKVEIIDLKKCWKGKTEYEKRKVLDLFDAEKLIKKIKEKRIIFLTQPLVDDEVLTEKEFFELLQKIFKNYDKKEIIFKVHPRDNFDYKKYFENMEYLKTQVPFEILEYMNIEIDTIVTLFSTAAYTMKAKKIDFYGTKIHPKLLKKFGTIEFDKSEVKK